MYKYLLVFLVSLSFFAFLIPKKKALLRVAGPTIVMAVLMGLGVGLAYDIDALDDRSFYLLVGSVLFFMVGLMDDLGIFRLWWHRLVGQILVLSTMIPIAVPSLRSDVYRFFHIRNIHHALGLRHWATWTAVNSICVPCAHQLHLQVEHCRVQRTRHGG